MTAGSKSGVWRHGVVPSAAAKPKTLKWLYRVGPDGKKTKTGVAVTDNIWLTFHGNGRNAYTFEIMQGLPGDHGESKRVLNMVDANDRLIDPMPHWMHGTRLFNDNVMAVARMIREGHLKLHPTKHWGWDNKTQSNIEIDDADDFHAHENRAVA